MVVIFRYSFILLSIFCLKLLILGISWHSTVDLCSAPLQWRHNEHGGVSNHQPYDCLLNRLFRRRSKKTSKLRVTGLCEGNSPVTGEFPHKRPVTRKMFPFDDVIMPWKDLTRSVLGSKCLFFYWYYLIPDNCHIQHWVICDRRSILLRGINSGPSMDISNHIHYKV